MRKLWIFSSTSSHIFTIIRLKRGFWQNLFFICCKLNSLQHYLKCIEQLVLILNPGIKNLIIRFDCCCFSCKGIKVISMGLDIPLKIPKFHTSFSRSANYFLNNKQILPYYIDCMLLSFIECIIQNPDNLGCIFIYKSR